MWFNDFWNKGIKYKIVSNQILRKEEIKKKIKDGVASPCKLLALQLTVLNGLHCLHNYCAWSHPLNSDWDYHIVVKKWNPCSFCTRHILAHHPSKCKCFCFMLSYFLLSITIGIWRYALFIFLSDHEWRAKVLRHLISLFVNLSSSAGDLTTCIHTYFLQRRLLANFHFPYLLFCGEVEAIKSSAGGGMDYDKVTLCVKQTPVQNTNKVQQSSLIKPHKR